MWSLIKICINVPPCYGCCSQMKSILFLVLHIGWDAIGDKEDVISACCSNGEGSGRIPFAIRGDNVNVVRNLSGAIAGPLARHGLVVEASMPVIILLVMGRVVGLRKADLTSCSGQRWHGAE